ncbi:t-complex protein 1, delta SU (nucleomorph) [Cryptomonas paramecium]|uniref:T-complex protein 1, delta SU n=1 Tax=Cryptomonas paramaecium TaxID=2898 RepID=F2HHI2_9CRYP|nr:t-complex protein 1, delta SU [Cryptomonas paramecium]AEA38778.1 t-complex protein 1, delta SU [Cryptomonas paramecium]
MKNSAKKNQISNISIKEKDQVKYIQKSNMNVAKKVSDAIRTSLGPHGLDKCIIYKKGILVTNDGATILKNAIFNDPVAKMLVNISISQDVEIGDGTTSVVILTGSFLGSCVNLIEKGISPLKISDNFRICLKKVQKILMKISLPINIKNKNGLYHIASTSLESKIISVQSHILSSIAVKSVLKIIDMRLSCDVDLKNIKIIKKTGGTIEQTELLEGIGIEYSILKAYNGPIRICSAKIALIQFAINIPTSETENTLVIKNYSCMDKMIKEEKQYIVGICRKIKATKCNVLLVQKSIIKESICSLALQILAEMQIMVIKDIERDDLEFIVNSLNCVPIADIESMKHENFAFADCVEERLYGQEKIIIFKGVKNVSCKTATVVIRSSNTLLLKEAERSFYDALCVIRSIIRRRYLVAGGGSSEIEISFNLRQFSKSITGVDCFCIIAFASSLEIIPYILSENAGLEPIQVISKLKKLHFFGNKFAGINVKRGLIENMFKSNVVLPLLVLISTLNMSVEFVIQLLKIDDMVASI